MNNKFRKLILLSSTAFATALTLTTSTFAWFKINSTGTVENFDFQVVGGNGFLVSIDGEHYTSNLTKEQIDKAIAVAYGNGTYEVLPFKDYGTPKQESAKDVFYKISYSTEGEKIYTELKDEKLEEELEDIVTNKILVMPVTTTDGYNFKTISSGNTTYKPQSGMYTQFSVYFKTESDNVEDDETYDVYVTGYSGLNKQGDTIVPTLMTSEVRKLKLASSLTAVKNGVVTPFKAGETFEVYTSNSTRISSVVSELKSTAPGYEKTQDQKFMEGKTYYLLVDGDYIPQSVTVGSDVDENDVYYEYKESTSGYELDGSSSLIYEINDTTHGDEDLGSYATDYSDVDNKEVYNRYSSTTNAMFTYYNNIVSAERRLTALSYDALPQNVVSKLPKADSEDLTSVESAKDADANHYKSMVQLKSGDAAKKITFSIWLEGWDADNIDGLANPVDVRLSFASKRLYN